MKRYVSLICIFCLLLMFIGKPIAVSASSFEPTNSTFIDLFSLQDHDNRVYTSYSGNFSILFDIPLTFVDYVEFYLVTNVDITSISVSGISCNFERLGSYYRVYCSISNVKDELVLDISGSNSNSFLYFHSAVFSSSELIPVHVPCQFESLITNEPYFFSYNGSSISIPTVGTNGYLYNDFVLKIYIDNYKLYDYINLFMSFFVSSITSVTVGIADQTFIPYELSYIENPSDDFNNDDRYKYFVKLCLDLSDLDLSRVNEPITITISGMLEDLANSEYNYCTVIDVSGFFVSTEVNPIIFWFRKTYHGLNTWFDSLLDVLQNIYNGNTVPGNSFQQQVDLKDQQLEDMAAVMESVEQPDLNSVNVSANSYVDGIVLAASMSGITSVFSEGLFFDMVVMSIMMATAGYVLFGKR